MSFPYVPAVAAASFEIAGNAFAGKLGFLPPGLKYSTCRIIL